MPQTAASPHSKPALEFLSRQQYNAISNVLQAKVSTYSRNAYIIQNVTNQALAQLANLKQPIADIGLWTETVTPIAVNHCFNELRLYAYKYALQILERVELAEDISHDALILLLKNLDNVTFVKGWLRTTVRNLALKALQNSSIDAALARELRLRCQSLPDSSEADVTRQITELSHNDVKQMLSAPDYRTYLAIESHKTLKAYAVAMQISYQTAREHNLHIHTNLRAAVVQREGWTSSPTILNYQNLHNIKLFIHKLVDYNCRGELAKLRHCHSSLNKADVQAALVDFSEVKDWGITNLGGNEYRLMIFDRTSVPVFAFLYISINRANRISLHKAEHKEISERIPNPRGVKIPLRQGRIALTIEEIKALISYKEPYTCRDK